MKRFTIFLVIIILFTLYLPTYSVDLTNIFISTDNIKKHLEVLSSEEFQGRLIGTSGNEKTIEYIKEHFKEYGLKPLENSFTHEFDALNLEYKGVPRFNILDKEGNVFLSLEEGIDYKIRVDDYSYVGGFNGSFKYIDNKEQILSNKYNYDNLAILLDYNNESIQETGQNEGQIDDRIYYKGAKAIIYPEYGPISLKDLNLGNKNIHLNQSGLIKLGVDPEIFERLISFSSNGCKIDIDIPVVFNTVKSANVIGMIEGKSKNFNNIIIATSIDGLGVDAKGDILAGTVDNGAATSLLLELSRVLSTNERIDSNLIFVGLNGNKLGDRGFDNFFRIKGIDPTHTQVIYLDKIGTKNRDITAGTYTNESTEFKLNRVIFNDMINTINKMGLDYKSDENYLSSDYINFRFRGIMSLVLTNGFNENIGTINDNLENVDIDSVFDIGSITLNYIKDFGNLNILKELWKIFISIWYLFVLGVVLIAIHNYSREELKNDQIKGNIIKGVLANKPIITIYLILAFLIAIFIIQTKHGLVLSEGILYQDTNISLMGVLNTFGESILSSSLMFGYLFIYIFPLVIGIVVLKVIADRIKLSEKVFLRLVCIGSTLTVLYGFYMIYKFNYSSIFPKLLSLPNLNTIVIVLIGLYNFIIIYFLKKEINEVTTFRLMVVYILLNIMFVSAIYSPYIFNKTIINIRNTSGVIRF